jgi:hypothetical protein
MLRRRRISVMPGRLMVGISIVAAGILGAWPAAGSVRDAQLELAVNSFSINGQPAGAGDFLDGVSCASVTTCMAAGSKGNGAGVPLPLAEMWTAHTRWAALAPAVAGNSQLNGVSCSSAAQCMAAGFVYSGGVPAALAELWNGTAWTISPTLSPGSADSLQGVSCPSATSCTAVGWQQTGTVIVPLAEAWNGTSWSVQPTPAVPGASSYLEGVSCTSAAWCVAAGYSVPTSTSTSTTLIEAWNGTAWRTVPSPNPSTTTNQLLAVSCTSATACTAAGDYVPATPGIRVPLAELWNGSVWAAQKPAYPTGASYALFDGVSCVSTATCTAVGYYEGSSGATLTLAERRLAHSPWSIQTTTNPSPSPDLVNYLLGVSCASSSACTAVGAYESGTPGSFLTLAERWTGGTTWRTQSTPSPP